MHGLELSAADDDTDDAAIVATLPLLDEADRFGERYAASGALGRVQRAPYLFFPVDRGVVQVGVPEEHNATGTGGQPLEKSAYVGSITIRSGRARFDIDRASSASVSVGWKKGNPGDLSLLLKRPEGAARSLIWTAEESPDSLEAVPTGRQGPASTSPLTIYLGATRRGVAVRLRYDYDADKDNHGSSQGEKRRENWSLELDLDAMSPQPDDAPRPDDAISPKPDGHAAVLWLTHGKLPLISSAAMTRSSTSSGLPSGSRGLIPLAIAARLKLAGRHDAAIPFVASFSAAKIVVDWPWPVVGKSDAPVWGPPAVATTLPTLAGVEFLPTHPEQPYKGVSAALRLDLPALDEFFAAVAPPKPKGSQEKDENEPDSEEKALVSETPVPTALDLERLAREVWDQRKMSLALTRTQSARATLWHPPESLNPMIYNLAEPYPWAATFAFREVLGGDKPIDHFPLGVFSIEWTGDSGSGVIVLRGDTALRGLTTGKEIKSFTIKNRRLVALNQDGKKIKLVGFAPALYQHPDSTSDPNPRFDTRGFGAADRATPDVDNFGPAGSLRIRVAAILQEDVAGAKERVDFDLGTLEKPVTAGLPRNKKARFWFRDLPFIPPIAFNPRIFHIRDNAFEQGLGPDPRVFDRDKAPYATFEWRFFDAEPVQDAPSPWTLFFDGLWFKPLRLWKVETEAGGQSFRFSARWGSAKVTCRMTRRCRSRMTIPTRAETSCN